jgi:glycosyltransferase involved in cell wall biosynthesis
VSARILHIARSLRLETGGVASAVRSLAAAQRRHGDAVTVASLDPADAADPSVVVCGRRSEGYGYAAEYVPWLRARRREFDAVIVHGLWQYQSFGAWRALQGTETPYFVFCHGMLDPWFKHAHRWKHAKKWLYWPWAEYRVLRDAAAVCFTAEAERRKARTSFCLYRAQERIASLGVETATHDPGQQRDAFFARHSELRGRSFLLFLGRVHPKKGVGLLLRGYAAGGAAAGGEHPLLVIAGPSADDAYRQELQAEVNRLGLERAVVWLPMLTGDIKWGALRSCEAFVLFSYQENFSIAVVEALACARPVLISDRIDICAEVAGDEAGIVVPPTEEGVTDALRQWARFTSAQREQMQARAAACFDRRFRIERAVEALSRIIAEARHVTNPA